MTQLPSAYPIRIDTELMAKAKIIAKRNGRSFNKEIEMLIMKHVYEYEAKHGKVNIETEQSKSSD